MQSDGSLRGQIVAEIGVAIAVEGLLRAGFLVAVPIVDDGYDLLAFSGRRCWRIQVKATGARNKNKGRVRIRRGQNKRSSYCPVHVDAFVAVQVETRVCVCVPVSECRTSHWISFSRYADGDFSPLLRVKHKSQRC